MAEKSIEERLSDIELLLGILAEKIGSIEHHIAISRLVQTAENPPTPPQH